MRKKFLKKNILIVVISSIMFLVCLLTGTAAYADAEDAPEVSMILEDRISVSPVIPKLLGVENVDGGVKITWERVSGDVTYRVYYRTGNGAWTKIGDTASTGYIWTGAKSGTTYTFTVRCISKRSSDIGDRFDRTGKSIRYIAAPELTKVSSLNPGISISWNQVTGAEKYRIYYKTGNGSWNRLAETTDTDYMWNGAEAGVSYTFTVRCISSDSKCCTSGYDSQGMSFVYLKAPKLTDVENVDGGVKICWDQVAGAEKYRVFYRLGTGGWTKAGDTQAASFIWNKAENGTRYTFTVRCVSRDGKNYTSDFDAAGKTITCMAAPKLTYAKNTKDGVQISWKDVTGAEKYRIYYKIGSGKWIRLADTTAAGYTWTGAKGGTDYTFTVRCISKDSISGYDHAGISVTRLLQPEISKIEANNSGVVITWNHVAGASRYRVYYKSGSGWKFLKETTDTTYTVNATIGKNYFYTVKALNHSSESSYNNVGTSFQRLETPAITNVKKENNGIRITWNPVGGAEKYRIYYKTDGGSWIGIANTTSANYLWKGAKKDTAYRFTVRCVTGDGRISVSGYDTLGKIVINSEEQEMAAQVLDKVGWNLRAAFEWACGMPYERFYDDPVPAGYTKCKWYSLYGFKNYRGNCHVMACTFYQMAILLGYDAHYVFGYVPLQRGGIGEHGWVEIEMNGKIYVCDPDFTLYSTVDKGYMFTYGTRGTWKYQNYHREN